MNPKLIALIISTMDSETTQELYRGITETANQYQYSTQGYVIFPSQNSSEEYNNGEFIMFETIDFSKFDGLIVALNTISSEKTKELVLARISQTSIPAICIDCDVENGYKINTTNYGSEKEMVDHLINVHHKKKINYVSGPANNAESNLRMAAYKDAMAEHGLDYEGRIYTGSFYVEDGKRALAFFDQSEKGKDYDAIICGNDMAAISVACDLKKMGKRIPEDVCVTGFDNISETNLHFPSLTTITKHNKKVGILAVDLLHKLWNGETIPRVSEVESSLVFRRSCGCPEHSTLYDSIDRAFANTFEFNKLCQIYNRIFIESGTECNSFGEYLLVLQKFIESIKPFYYSLMILDEFTELFELESYPMFTFPDAGGNFVKMRNVMLYAGGNFAPLQKLPIKNSTITFENKDMMPMANMPVFHFLNTPLHFMEQRIGFFMFANTEFPLMSTLFSNWVSSMNISISNIYNKMLLTELYRKDPLTGIKNRFGLDYYWRRFVQDAENQKQNMVLIFADMNGLKMINDQFGHEHGDHAIIQVANALMMAESPRMKAIRYGGDEFLLLGYGYSMEEAEKIAADIQGELATKLVGPDQDCEVSVSIGIYERVVESTESLDECIKKADSVMYEHKVAYHQRQKKS